jgi:hypothetical protein
MSLTVSDRVFMCACMMVNAAVNHDLIELLNFQSFSLFYMHGCVWSPNTAMQERTKGATLRWWTMTIMLSSLTHHTHVHHNWLSKAKCYSSKPATYERTQANQDEEAENFQFTVTATPISLIVIYSTIQIQNCENNQLMLKQFDDLLVRK